MHELAEQGDEEDGELGVQEGHHEAFERPLTATGTVHRLVGSVATGGLGQERLDPEPGEEGGAAVADQIKQQRGLGDQHRETQRRDEGVDPHPQAVAERRGHPVALPPLHRIADDQRQAGPRTDGPHHANGGERQPTRHFHTLSFSQVECISL
ncbi:hypothetical protein D3C80_772280 [compost metagenome]